MVMKSNKDKEIPSDLFCPSNMADTVDARVPSRLFRAHQGFCRKRPAVMSSPLRGLLTNMTWATPRKIQSSSWITTACPVTDGSWIWLAVIIYITKRLKCQAEAIWNYIIFSLDSCSFTAYAHFYLLQHNLHDVEDKIDHLLFTHSLQRCMSPVKSPTALQRRERAGASSQKGWL